MADTDPSRPWLTIEFAGFNSAGDALFRINGALPVLNLSHDDLLEAFRGMLPTEDPALGRPVHTEPGWQNHPPPVIVEGSWSVAGGEPL